MLEIVAAFEKAAGLVSNLVSNFDNGLSSAMTKASRYIWHCTCVDLIYQGLTYSNRKYPCELLTGGLETAVLFLLLQIRLGKNSDGSKFIKSNTDLNVKV